MRPITCYLTKARNVTAIALQQCAPDKICPETVFPWIQWPSLASLVLSWLHMVSYGLVWPPLAPFDLIWPSTASFDHILVWLVGHYLARFCPIWPGFALYGQRVLYPEMEKGVEHGSIAPRRKWTGPFLATRASCNMCIMQHVHHATRALCNT